MRLAVDLFKHPFLSTPSSDFTRMVDSCSALGLHSWCMRRGACILAPATLQGTRTAYLCRSGCTGSCTSRCRPPTSGLPIRTRSILAGVFALPLARPKRGYVAEICEACLAYRGDVTGSSVLPTRKANKLPGAEGRLARPGISAVVSSRRTTIFGPGDPTVWLMIRCAGHPTRR